MYGTALKTCTPLEPIWICAPILVGRSRPRSGYGHSEMTIKEWLICPIPRSTFLWVVHEYWLLPVALWTYVLLLDRGPIGCFKIEFCAPVSTRNSTGFPSTFRVTGDSWRGHKPWHPQLFSSSISNTFDSPFLCLLGYLFFQWPISLQYAHWSFWRWVLPSWCGQPSCGGLASPLLFHMLYSLTFRYQISSSQ